MGAVLPRVGGRPPSQGRRYGRPAQLRNPIPLRSLPISSPRMHALRCGSGRAALIGRAVMGGALDRSPAAHTTTRTAPVPPACRICFQKTNWQRSSYGMRVRDITFEAFMEKYKDATSLDEIVKTVMELPGKPYTGESLYSQLKGVNA